MEMNDLISLLPVITFAIGFLVRLVLNIPLRKRYATQVSYDESMNKILNETLEDRLNDLTILRERFATCVEIPDSLMDLIDQAKPIIEAVDELQVSGEYKRHQVYARMLKENPEANKREVAKAIELALD